MNAKQMLLTIQSIDQQMKELRQQREDLQNRIATVMTMVPMGSYLDAPEGKMQVTSSFVRPNFYSPVPHLELIICGKLVRKDGSVGVKGGSKVTRYTVDELEAFVEQ
jgi:hypothetical protein